MYQKCCWASCRFKRKSVVSVFIFLFAWCCLIKPLLWVSLWGRCAAVCCTEADKIAAILVTKCDKRYMKEFSDLWCVFPTNNPVQHVIIYDSRISGHYVISLRFQFQIFHWMQNLSIETESFSSFRKQFISFFLTCFRVTGGSQAFMPAFLRPHAWDQGRGGGGGCLCCFTCHH